MLKPGQKLRLVELSSRMGVSQAVLREALTRLGGQGLVVASPQRGFRVCQLSIDDVVSLTEARVSIETMALRLAIERGDIGWETGILTAYHILDNTPVTNADGTVNGTLSIVHRDFHRSLLAGCGNSRIEAIANSLRDGAELYRRWYWVLTADHHHNVAADHLQLKELVLAREVEAAVELLASHIELAPKQLIAHAREHGEANLHTAAPAQSPVELIER